MIPLARGIATIGVVPSRVPGCEIRVRGRLSDAVLFCFDGLAGDVAGGDTILRGGVADQVVLYGLLDRIQSLGLELIELRWLPTSESST